MDDELQLFAETATRWSTTFANADAAAVLAEGADLGLCSLLVPASAGGLEQDLAALSAVLRPIARVDAAIATALLVHASAQLLVAATGAWPSAIGATELLAWPAFTDFGGDVSLDGASATGHCSMVPLAPLAKHLLLSAGGRLVLVRVGDSIDVTRVEVLGLRRCPVGDVTLRGVPVVDLGPASQGLDLHASIAVAVTAIALGLLEGTLETALAYARQRRQGGRPTVEWPEVRRLLGALRASTLVLESALVGVHAARRAGSAWQAAAHATAAHAIDAACTGTTDGVQLLGGNGYVTHYPQERRMRDARQLRCLLRPHRAD